MSLLRRPNAAAAFWHLTFSPPKRLRFAAHFSSSPHHLPSTSGFPFKMPAARSPIRVFIAGGSYAGLSAAGNLLDLCEGRNPRMFGEEEYTHHKDHKNISVEITIADERDGYYHLIGSPLALADKDYAKKAWVKFTDIPAFDHPSVNFVIGSVTAVDPAAKTATTIDTVTKEATVHAYDYFFCGTGLRRVWPTVPQSLTKKQFLIEAEEQIHTVTNARHGVVVVGGGAVGIEMAAELKLVAPNVNVTLAHSRDKLLSSEGLSDECKDRSLELLREAGVDVLLNHRLLKSNKVETLDGSTKYDVEFENGHRMSASEVIMAVSRPTPTTSYLPESVLTPEGLVKINANLSIAGELPNASYHFCAGDAADWPGIKRCGGAMHGGHYAAQNIHQNILNELTGQEVKHQVLEVWPPCIGLAIGKQAVASGADGTTYGEDVMQSYFRDDLGWTICWDYMELGKKTTSV